MPVRGKMRPYAALGVLALTLLACGAAGSGAAAAGRPCVSSFYATISYCRQPDGSVSISNLSHSVIDVKASGPTTISLPPNFSASISDYAAHVAVPDKCASSRSCSLAPGGLMFARKPAGKALTFTFDLTRTLRRNAAVAIVDRLQAIGRSPGRPLAAQAGQCVSRVGGAVKGPGGWQAALKDGLDRGLGRYGDCKAVASALRTKSGGGLPFGTAAVGWTRTVGNGAWISEMARLFGKKSRR